MRAGLKGARGARMPHNEFRTTMTTPEGLHKTDIFLGRIINLDLTSWTVDVVSQFDQMYLPDIPIGTPYQHVARGEGMYVIPEVGAKCAVCWPGDSSPPFVLCFVMPHELDQTSDDDQSPVKASFGGGRQVGKPGDMVMRGRDGNQVVLHRGGVLQIGATELSQRIYVPLQNMILDFCENYSMQNSGGSIRWGIQEGEGKASLPTEHVETYRVYADDKYGDIRIATGKVHYPTPDDDTGITDAEVGSNGPVVYEFTFSKNGFRAEDGGVIQATGNNVKLKFTFDRNGNAAMRIDGNAYIRCKKKLSLNVDGDILVRGGGGVNVQITGDVKFTAGGVIEITGAVIKLNNGSNPIARLGDTVVGSYNPQLLVAAPTPLGFAPISSVPALMGFTATITGPGNSTVLA